MLVKNEPQCSFVWQDWISWRTSGSGKTVVKRALLFPLWRKSDEPKWRVSGRWATALYCAVTVTRLDEWRLHEWLDLLMEDARYEVPATDRPDGDASTTLFIVSDDLTRLRSRVEQLLGKSAWAEPPRSRTRRCLSNVRIRAIEGETIEVTANFVVYRLRFQQMDTYVGRYEYTLVRRDGRLKIRARRAILDLEALRLHSKMSIIL